MDKKKNPKRKPPAGKKEKKPVNKKLILIITAAVLAVAAAITVLTVKVIIPRKQEREALYPETALYKGKRVPEEYVAYLEGADRERAELCEKDGVAMTIGDYEIPAAELEMAYYDIYFHFLMNVFYDNYDDSIDYTNFPIEKFPEESKMADGTLWSDYFMGLAKDNLRRFYVIFDTALKEGFIPTREQCEEIGFSIANNKKYAEKFENGVEELLEKSYCPEVTENIFSAYSIRLGYSTQFFNEKSEEIKEKISQQEIDQKIKGREFKYKLFEGRVCKLPAGAAGYEGLKTESEYLDYCNKINSAVKDYDAEKDTQASYAQYKNASAYFSDELLDYMYSPERKAGEISAFKDKDAEYLIYVEKPGRYENSYEAIVYYEAYNDEKGRESFDNSYKKWVDGGADEERLDFMCQSIMNQTAKIPFGRVTVRPGDVNFEVDRWANEPGRKNGDYKKFESEYLGVIVYFISDNKEDTDDRYYMSQEIAEEKYDEKYLPDIPKYEIKENKEIIATIPPMAHDAMTENINLLNNTASQY